MTFGGYVRLQLKKTLVTGIPQIVQAHGIVRKLIKVIVFVFCVSACLYQIIGYLQVYYEYPIIVDVFVNRPSEVREPAFSVCPHNSIKAGAYCLRFKNDCTKNYKEYRDFCNMRYKYCMSEEDDKYMNQSGGPFPLVGLNDMAQYRPGMSDDDLALLKRAFMAATRLRDFPQTGLWTEGTDVEEIEPVAYRAFTDLRLPVQCHAYGVIWGNAEAEVKNVTLKYDIGVLASTESMFFGVIPKAIQVAIHDPMEKVNPFESGFALKAGLKYNIYLQKTEKFLLPSPYPTQCTDYVAEWKQKGGEGPISQTLCIEYCLQNRSLERYNCFNPMFITTPSEDYFCYDRSYTPNTEDYDDCRAKCPDACWQISFDAKVEESELTEAREGGDLEYKTRLVFHLSRLDVMTFTYKRKYESVEVFGYVGGYLGMWLGFSLIAAFDFFEIIMTIVCYSCKKPNKIKKKTTPVNYYSTPKQMFI